MYFTSEDWKIHLFWTFHERSKNHVQDDEQGNILGTVENCTYPEEMIMSLTSCFMQPWKVYYSVLSSGKIHAKWKKDTLSISSTYSVYLIFEEKRGKYDDL